MSEENRCSICEAYFRANAMVGEKCKQCNTLYPKAKTKEDIKVKFRNKVETLTEGRVKDLIYEILEEANIKRHECEKCGKLYYRTSPAQKVCKACKVKEDK
jgi:uncharacterized OB-fold protein